MLTFTARAIANTVHYIHPKTYAESSWSFPEIYTNAYRHDSHHAHLDPRAMQFLSNYTTNHKQIEWHVLLSSPSPLSLVATSCGSIATLAYHERIITDHNIQLQFSFDHQSLSAWGHSGPDSRSLPNLRLLEPLSSNHSPQPNTSASPSYWQS